MRDITRQEALLLNLFDKAMRGDVRAANLLIAMVQKLLPPEPADEAREEVTESDREIIEDFLDRHRNHGE